MASLNGPARRSAPAASPWAWAPLFLLTTSCQVIFGLDEYTERTGGTGGAGGGTSTTTSSGGGGGAGGAGGSTTGTGGQGGTLVVTPVDVEHDSYLFSTNPTLSYGDSPTMLLSDNQRPILRFNIGADANHEITGSVTRATLTIHAESSAQGTIKLYQISSANAGWNEGSGKGTETPDAACWNEKSFQSAPWAGSPGLGDSSVDYIIGSEVTSAKTGDVYTWDVTNIVQSWLQTDVAQNAGLLLLPEMSGQPVITLYPQEYQAGAVKPTIAVEHD